MGPARRTCHGVPRRCGGQAHGRGHQNQNAGPGLDPADFAFRALGWLVPVCRDLRKGAHAAHHRRSAGRCRGLRAVPRVAPHGRAFAHAAHRMACILRNGASQQCRPIHAHRVGPVPYREWASLNSECHDAAFHRSGGACPHGRRKADTAAAGRSSGWIRWRCRHGRQ